MDNINRQTPVNLEEFSKKSLEYYKQVRQKLENEAMSKFVALDYETSQYWLGETASEALIGAKKRFPNKLFYLLQVGSPSTFSVQSFLPTDIDKRGKDYGFTWAH